MRGIPFVINFTDASLPGKKRFTILPKTTDGPLSPNLTALDTVAKEQHTSLILPGHGLAEYAIRVNQDIVWLLERFASKIPPVNPTIGQIWYDYEAATPKVWDGDMWTSVGGDKTIATVNEYNFLIGKINSVLNAPAIDAPVNVSPANNATNVVPAATLVGSNFHSRYGIAQASAQFQISTVVNFTTTVVDEVKTGPTSTFTYGANLAGNKIFYWRMRFTDAQGAKSSWSSPTQFRTASATINAPTITLPTNGAINVVVEPLLQCSPISVFNGTDTLDSCEWEIWTGPNATGTRVVGRPGNSGYAFQVSPNVLVLGQKYYARVRQKGETLGISPWSPESSFSTPAVSLSKPTIVSPTAGATISLTETLIGSNINVVGGTDTLTLSTWEVRRGPNATGTVAFTGSSTNSKQITIPNATITAGQPYFIRVRYTGAKYGVSPWSDYVPVTAKVLTAGTVISNFCSGTTYMAVVATADGGTVNQVVEQNSAQCGYVPPPTNPAAGTVLVTHCVGTSKYNTVADGNGSSNEVLVEANSTSCGYVAPNYPAAGTVLSSHCVSFDKYNIVANGSGGSTDTLVEANSAYCGYAPKQPIVFIAGTFMNALQQMTAYSNGSGQPSAFSVTFKTDGTCTATVSSAMRNGTTAAGTTEPVQTFNSTWLFWSDGSGPITGPGVGAPYYIQLNGDVENYNGGTGAASSNILTGPVGKPLGDKMPLTSDVTFTWSSTYTAYSDTYRLRVTAQFGRTDGSRVEPGYVCNMNTRGAN